MSEDQVLRPKLTVSVCGLPPSINTNWVAGKIKALGFSPLNVTNIVGNISGRPTSKFRVELDHHENNDRFLKLATLGSFEVTIDKLHKWKCFSNPCGNKDQVYNPYSNKDFPSYPSSNKDQVHNPYSNKDFPSYPSSNKDQVLNPCGNKDTHNDLRSNQDQVNSPCGNKDILSQSLCLCGNKDLASSPCGNKEPGTNPCGNEDSTHQVLR
ncbi:hypothetical protein ACLKA6_001564 [Drosophila palustris]